MNDTIHKGKEANGQQKQAKTRGTCGICHTEYTKGAKVIYLQPKYAVHPHCAYGEIEVTYLPKTQSY
jgi:hypothetical protein